LDFLTLWLSRLNWRFVLPVVGLLLLALLARSGYRLWHDQRTKDPLATLGPGLYQPTNPPTGDTLPLPSAAPRR
jgi:type II secretory pathway component PulL